MTDTDKLVAAIFSAALCGSKKADQEEYLNTYDSFLELMKKRGSARQKPLAISAAVLERSKVPARHR